MRVLIAVVLVLAGLWGGYWFFGARAFERGAEAWLGGMAARGMVAERQSLSVAGFPSRFDLTVEGLHLADPQRGIGWQAPFVQVFSLSYKPWHVIAALPDEQVVTLAGQRILVGSDRMQGSLVVRPGPALALDRLAVVAEGLDLQSDTGWRIGAEAVNFATRAEPSLADAHEIGVKLTGIAPDAALVAVLEGLLPGRIEVLEALVVADLDAPLDRHAGQTHPALEALEVKEARIVWGGLKLFAKGRIVADPQGRAEGRVDLRVEGWRQGYEAALVAGLVPANLSVALESVLTNLASQSGDADVLDLPLTLQNGVMSLGPLPLGPAPMLR